MSLVFALLLSIAASVAPGCNWDHPNADPYRGSLTAALADFKMTPATRDKLRAALEAHRYDDVVTITRDRIAGSHVYDHLRGMHSGNAQHCRGEVDRSGWAPERRELGLVYCADDACVLVPTICNNISLVTREPDRVAPLDVSPIDIEPAAGPPQAPLDTPALDLLPPPDIVGALPGTLDLPGGGDVPSGGFPGGGFPCCDTGPILPVAPVSPGVPPIAAVPEAPAWALLVAGLALCYVGHRRRLSAIEPDAHAAP